MANITRNLGNGVFTWTDVVTGVTLSRTEVAQGTAVVTNYSGTEVAWRSGTLTLAQSSTNTGTTDTAIITVSGNGAGGIRLYCTLNNVVCTIAGVKCAV